VAHSTYHSLFGDGICSVLTCYCSNSNSETQPRARRPSHPFETHVVSTVTTPLAKSPGHRLSGNKTPSPQGYKGKEAMEFDDDDLGHLSYNLTMFQTTYNPSQFGSLLAGALPMIASRSLLLLTALSIPTFDTPLHTRCSPSPPLANESSAVNSEESLVLN